MKLEQDSRRQTEEKIKRQLEEYRLLQFAMLDHENLIHELKREVNELCRRLGESVRLYGLEVGPTDFGEPDL